MVFGKLYGKKGNPRTDPIIAVAKSNNLELEIIETFPGDDHSEYAKWNRLGKIPTFVDSENFVLHETIAICIYFASQNEKTTLLGNNKKEYAAILKWMSFMNSDLVFASAGWFHPFLGVRQFDKQVSDKSLSSTLHLLKNIEEGLTNTSYLVGENLTLADLFCACLAREVFRYKLDKKWRTENPNTTRWYTNVISQPIFYESCETFPFIDEVIEYETCRDMVTWGMRPKSCDHT